MPPLGEVNSPLHFQTEPPPIDGGGCTRGINLNGQPGKRRDAKRAISRALETIALRRTDFPTFQLTPGARER